MLSQGHLSWLHNSGLMKKIYWAQEITDFSEGFKINTVIEAIYMRFNKIGNQGLIALSELLKFTLT